MEKRAILTGISGIISYFLLAAFRKTTVCSWEILNQKQKRKKKEKEVTPARIGKDICLVVYSEMPQNKIKAYTSVHNNASENSIAVIKD